MIQTRVYQEELYSRSWWFFLVPFSGGFQSIMKQFSPILWDGFFKTYGLTASYTFRTHLVSVTGVLKSSIAASALKRAKPALNFSEKWSFVIAGVRDFRNWYRSRARLLLYFNSISIRCIRVISCAYFLTTVLTPPWGRRDFTAKTGIGSALLTP